MLEDISKGKELQLRAHRSIGRTHLVMHAAMLVQELFLTQRQPDPGIFFLDLPLREAREAFERAYFEHHLQREQGSISRVAEKSGLERTHLYRKLKSLGVAAARKEEKE